MDVELISGILMLLTSLGAFMIGFKLLSENVEKLSSKGLKRLFAKTSNNRLVSVGIGAATTTLVQSSSITTVMMVGFVNAGLMTLLQATSLIMGANIGSTTTGLIAALGAAKSGASIGVVEIAMLLTPVGIFMNILGKKDKIKTIGAMLAGLGLLLFGIDSMSGAMSALKDNEGVKNLLISVKNPLLLLLIGAVLTAVIQSSGAVTAIIITLAAGELVIGDGGNSMLYIILGSNIGTCSTALLSSLGAGTNAKRTSLIHLMFNVFGSMIFFVFLLIYKDFKVNVLEGLIEDPALQIALFHTFFNVTCTLIFLPFANVFVKVSEKLIKNKDEVDESKGKFIDERFISIHAVAITQIEKEIARLGDLSMKSLNTSFNAFVNKDKDARSQVYKEIDVVQALNDEITNYIVKVSANDLSLQDEQTLSSLHHVLSDILRISEVSDNLVKYTARYVDEELVFSDNVILSLQNMYSDVTRLYDLAIKAFVEHDASLLPAIDDIEEGIDAARTRLINDHIKRLNEGRCKPENSGVFINLVGNLERIGDHICYVAHSIEQH